MRTVSSRWLLAMVVGMTVISAAEIPAAEPLSVNGTQIEIKPPGSTGVINVGPEGGTLIANSAVEVAGSLRWQDSHADGLRATFIARSLRGVMEDDWRQRNDRVGERVDAVIDWGSAPGTPADRKAFGIGGSDSDWEQVSIQWDGLLQVPPGGVELATASDDGSRVWLDRNGDGAVQREEWGVNGWSGGQGTTTRMVHAAVGPGRCAVRVQYEEGNGGNAIQFLWRTTGAANWSVIPAEAFRPRPRLFLSGPITFRADSSGQGHLDCGDGVVLAVSPRCESITVSGRVQLGCDLDFGDTPIYVSKSGVLDLAGHQMQASTISGGGIIDVSAGRLVYTGSILPVQIRGNGALACTADTTQVQALASENILTGDRYAVRVDDLLYLRGSPGPLAITAPVCSDGDDVIAMELTITVPVGGSGDAGIGVWRCDRHGRWFQALVPGPLMPGTQQVRVSLDALAALKAEGHGGRWNAAMAREQNHLGILVYGTSGGAPLSVTTRVIRAAITNLPTQRLTDLVMADFDGQQAHALTGQRWQWSVRPEPYPADPFDPDVFRLDCAITEPDGTVRRIAGFHEQAVERIDRGDSERFRDVGAPHFSVRFRPRMAGVHQISAIVGDASGERHITLPELLVSGPEGDGIVHVDAEDPRFFSVNGKQVWPLGHNLHSTYDVRAVAAVHSAPTPDRGSFTREVLLRRLAAAGGTGCETWLSAWNLGLEWNSDWDGYHDAGRYHAGHAWAVDHFLDLAESLGVRVNLSIFNHGMARDGAGAEMEWPDHPWNRANGGWLDAPVGLFTDERAFAAQQRMFRYLTARYSDSPALLGWKLWAEVNLAHAPVPDVVAWHDRASAALAAADPYGRAVTSHWCGDWHNADPQICAQDHIGYITIDAYHGDGTFLPNLLAQSTRDPLTPKQGLANFNKPIWVTEFGGSAFACPLPRLEAEHTMGPWVGLVTGHAASPMLWWFEWIDQGGHYGVFHALDQFRTGEDLRGAANGCIAPQVTGTFGAGWSRAWRSPQRILGYVVDQTWGMSGGPGRDWQQTTVAVDEVPAGTWQWAWWDADAGRVRSVTTVEHAGGRLVAEAPRWSRHFAFKLIRQ